MEMIADALAEGRHCIGFAADVAWLPEDLVQVTVQRHRDVVERVAAMLLERGSLSGDEVAVLVGGGTSSDADGVATGRFGTGPATGGVTETSRKPARGPRRPGGRARRKEE